MKATLISDNRQVIFPMSQMLERIKALAMPKLELEEDVVTLSSGGEEVSFYLYQTMHCPVIQSPEESVNDQICNNLNLTLSRSTWIQMRRR